MIRLLRALLLLNLGIATVAHSHQEHEETVPEDKRQELLAKWEQEVCIGKFFSSFFCEVQPLIMLSATSGVSPASQLLHICAVSSV